MDGEGRWGCAYLLHPEVCADLLHSKAAWGCRGEVGGVRGDVLTCHTPRWLTVTGPPGAGELPNCISGSGRRIAPYWGSAHRAKSVKLKNLKAS